MAEAKAIRHEVAGGYGHEGVRFSVGINSGAGGVGLGISDQIHAMASGEPQTTSLHLSLTSDDAEKIGQALLDHAAAVRARIAERKERGHA